MLKKHLFMGSNTVVVLCWVARASAAAAAAAHIQTVSV
jgi:hypothetical protein